MLTLITVRNLQYTKGVYFVFFFLSKMTFIVFCLSILMTGNLSEHFRLVNPWELGNAFSLVANPEKTCVFAHSCKN